MKLTEGLQYMDMENQITPVLGIDEFKSNIGDDSEMIVLNFTVAGKEVGKDLVSWLERGYEWIVDADVSPGEVLDKKYYVFAEMDRRSSAPKRIFELLQDLNTLTGIEAENWKIKIDDEKYPASVENLQKHMIVSPVEYAVDQEKDLNEWREIAGIPTINKHKTTDEDLLNWKRQAGII
jgi:hypothetical protein